MSKKSPKASEQSTSAASETTPLVAKSGDGGNGGDGSSDPTTGGLSTTQTTMLLAGEMAGSGVLALPRALVRTGWFGVPLIILMAGLAAFSGQRLGDCWSILEDRDPHMRSRKRNPYAIITEQALGKTWSVVVSMAIIVTLFGTSVVFLLMAAQIVQQLLLALVPDVTYCAWYLIVTGAMAPLMLLKSPKDFSLLGLIAFSSTVIACILYFIEMMNEIRPFVFRLGAHGFQEFFLAFGTIMFAFGGASTFPTIQNDMNDRSKFSKSVQYSFLGVLILYLVIAITGYAVYGEAVGTNFVTSLKPTPLTLVANVLMAVHLTSAFIIVVNPVCQEMEELYAVPRDSAGGRALVRISIMLAIMFLGESIPRFQTILAFVGGTSIALLTFVLPPLCYLRLCRQPDGEARSTVERPKWMEIVSWHVIAVGVVGGVLAAISSIGAIFGTSFATPCYLR